jgi:hypothetical protein
MYAQIDHAAPDIRLVPMAARFPCDNIRAMCRSIKVLRKPDQAPTAEELNAAALQFVRKISGFHKPSKANQEVFDRAVAEVAESSRWLLERLSKREHGAASIE